VTPRKRIEPVSFETVRSIALALPDVEDGTSYGTAALKVKKKLFIRLKEDGETIVLSTDPLSREYLLRDEPRIFFITDHYRDYPWVLVRLNAVSHARLEQLVEDAWRRVAPRALVARYDADRAR
jgi:hypothetical protein